MKTLIILSLAAGSLAACAVPPPSSTVYSYYQAQNEQTIRLGTVESVRQVTIVNPESGTGAMAGAALGGIGGSTVGSGTGQAAATVAGALVGGLLGQHAEANVNRRPGFEITVRFDNGELRAITQAADELFRPGERVRVLSSGYMSRVSH